MKTKAEILKILQKEKPELRRRASRCIWPSMPRPAVASAIYDAVGARLFALPLSAEKILLALQENGKGR